MIKFYAWEEPFKAKVAEARAGEAKMLKSGTFWMAFFGMLLFSGWERAGAARAPSLTHAPPACTARSLAGQPPYTPWLAHRHALVPGAAGL